MGQGQRHPGRPGRGSGAGSVVAWALTITDLDPIARTCCSSASSIPSACRCADSDIDFCEYSRDKVIAYVQEKYGP
jgi:DNA polymerase-3 subunit alpha